MLKDFSEVELNRLITDNVMENLNLEYKSSDSLSKDDRKKDDISKDVSSFANSDGGILIYGIKEFDKKEKRHLPEKIDAINVSDYSKEWLESIILQKIKPRIEGLKIYPIIWRKI